MSGNSNNSGEILNNTDTSTSNNTIDLSHALVRYLKKDSFGVIKTCDIIEYANVLPKSSTDFNPKEPYVCIVRNDKYPNGFKVAIQIYDFGDKETLKLKKDNSRDRFKKHKFNSSDIVAKLAKTDDTKSQDIIKTKENDLKIKEKTEKVQIDSQKKILEKRKATLILQKLDYDNVNRSNVSNKNVNTEENKEWEIKYYNLERKYHDLDSNYNKIKSNYTELKNSYHTLESNYTTINVDHKILKEKFEKQASKIEILEKLNYELQQNLLSKHYSPTAEANCSRKLAVISNFPNAKEMSPTRSCLKSLPTSPIEQPEKDSSTLNSVAFTYSESTPKSSTLLHHRKRISPIFSSDDESENLSKKSKPSNEQIYEPSNESFIFDDNESVDSGIKSTNTKEQSTKIQKEKRKIINMTENQEQSSTYSKKMKNLTTCLSSNKENVKKKMECNQDSDEDEKKEKKFRERFTSDNGNDMVHLKYGISIPESKWIKLLTLKDACKFTKHLFDEIYKEEVLNRCIKPSDLTLTPQKTHKRIPVSPKKIEAIEKSVKYYMKKKNPSVPQNLVDDEIKNVNSFISSWIHTKIQEARSNLKSK